MSDAIDLAAATAFIWLEADFLDSRDYEPWLALWTEDGRYVVPIDPDTDDFAAVLNYQYDDAKMRQARVTRLRSGQSMSAVSAARTVRTLSRLRVLESGPERATIRCAQHLVEYKRETQRLYAGDLTYRLVRTPGGLKLDQKIVRLINAADALSGIAYLL